MYTKKCLYCNEEFKTIHKGNKCLTYMMFIILIHAIWITSIIKHDGKCHYHDCNRCPYDGWCPMQEEKQHDADRELHS